MTQMNSPNGTLDALGKSLLYHMAEDQLNVLLIRHGQPGPGPEEDGLLGRPLTALGRQQAARLSKRLAQVPLTQIYCSDMARSYQTAEIVAKARPETPMEALADLREVGSFHQPGSPPARTAEQRRKLREQRAAVSRFVQRIRRQHRPGQTLAVITHGGINRLLLATLVGRPLRQLIMSEAHHTSITVVGVPENGVVRLKLLNCIRHLPASMMGSVNLPSVSDTAMGAASNRTRTPEPAPQRAP